MSIDMLWALLRTYLTLTWHAARAESGPKHIYAKKHKLYCFIKPVSLVKELRLVAHSRYKYLLSSK